MASLNTPLSSLIFVVVSSLLARWSYCFSPKLINGSLDDSGYSRATASWYGPPTGAGSDRGVCGYSNTLAQPPFNSFVMAGYTNDLFKHGEGCGACYEVTCYPEPVCSENPIIVTITDECPTCSGPHVFFHLSGTAFGALAKPGEAVLLRKLNMVNARYKRVPCHYPNFKISFTIDLYSTHPSYLAFVIEYVNGDGDLSSVEISQEGSNEWIGMKRLKGALWKVNLPTGTKGPYSVKLKTALSKQSIVATNVIPANWTTLDTYWSNVNF